VQMPHARQVERCRGQARGGAEQVEPPAEQQRGRRRLRGRPEAEQRASAPGRPAMSSRPGRFRTPQSDGHPDGRSQDNDLDSGEPYESGPLAVAAQARKGFAGEASAEEELRLQQDAVASAGEPADRARPQPGVQEPGRGDGRTAEPAGQMHRGYPRWPTHHALSIHTPRIAAPARR
jgi:hypothetical protein